MRGRNEKKWQDLAVVTWMFPWKPSSNSIYVLYVLYFVAVSFRDVAFPQSASRPLQTHKRIGTQPIASRLVSFSLCKRGGGRRRALSPSLSICCHVWRWLDWLHLAGKLARRKVPRSLARCTKKKPVRWSEAGEVVRLTPPCCTYFVFLPLVGTELLGCWKHFAQLSSHFRLGRFHAY